MNIRILCAALLIIPAIATAGVNTKNGNFYITYQDITQESDDHELNINRTYNSKSTKMGWFGYGWASIYETRMIVMPDGAVVVHEQGAGRENYYPSKDSSRLRAGVDEIVAVAIERDKLDSGAATALRRQLLASADLRTKKVLNYGIHSELPEGASVQSDCSIITRINNEYQRTTCGGGSYYFGTGIHYFDLAGHLIRNEEGDYKVNIHYAGNYPDRIEDTLGQKLYLIWNKAGQIDKAWTGTGKPVVMYSYDESGNLRKSNEIGGLFYKYQYDANHNMTQIAYIDSTHMDMTYDENSYVTSMTDTDGSKHTYAYRTDPDNPQHYWTTSTWISAEGEQSSREEEFLLKTDDVGVEQIASHSTTSGGRTQDVIMDAQGRIKRVNKPDGGFAEYTYHPTLNKISSVLTDEGQTDFQYNKMGDLVRAENSRGQLIRLEYDNTRHISHMVETSKSKRARRELSFKYNAMGKPTNIKLVGKGEINVEYDEAGQISKVESKQGSAMAIAVTEAFMTLLSVVKVAGVNLAMP